MIAEALLCLALNIYFEARSEDYASRIAVAQVTLNRVESDKFPDTVCAVVKQRHQFSWFWDDKSDKPYEKQAWKDSLALAEMFLEDRGIEVECVSDATHYHADYSRPRWRKFFDKYCKVGKHIFYKDNT
jgi:spore germination cell wall hydrolase CwlJ-like protein